MKKRIFKCIGKALLTASVIAILLAAVMFGVVYIDTPDSISYDRIFRIILVIFGWTFIGYLIVNVNREFDFK